jgi:hypothetical protein
MRRLTVVTLTLLLAVYPAVAQEKSDREKANLLGPVRSVRSTTIEYKDATLKVSLGTKELDTITYDEKGNQLEHIIDEFHGLPGNKEVRKYDTKGILVESVSSDAEGVIDRKVYTHENGKLMRVVSYNPDNTVEMTEINSYGKDGLLLETKYVLGKRPDGKTIYKYDARGNISEVAYYANSGARSIAVAGPCLGVHRVTYTYDEQRNRTKIVYYEPDGRIRQTFQYSYDTKGLVTAHYLEYYEAKQTFAYSYEFDSHGNWTRKVTTKDLGNKDFPDASKQVSVTSREISYY